MSTPPFFVVGPDEGGVSTRRLNRQRILDVVRRLGPISRADLSKRTQLSPPTISALVEELSSAHLLHEIGIGASSGGRPPILLEFNADLGSVAGIDVGPAAIDVAVADLAGQIVSRHRVPGGGDHGTPDSGQVLDAVDAAIDASGRDQSRLFAIAAAAPGQADVAGRVRAPGVPGWADVPLGDRLAARFDVPVLVDAHANMAATGERWRGVAQGRADFVFLALGARVGAGIVIGGRLHRGYQWQAGDIGGLMLDAPRPEAPDHVPSLVQRLAASVITLLDPELVVCGGTLMDQHPEVVDRLRTALGTLVRHLPAIERTALGGEAALVGAVHTARDLADAHVFALAGGARSQARAETA